MTDFILGVFEITIGMSLFIALLLLGLKLFGGKFTAKCRYIIWALVMLRLAIPFSFGLLPTLIEIPIDTELVQSEDLSSVPSENTDPITSVQPSDPGDVVVTPTTPSTPVFPNVDTANPGSTPILPVTPTVPGDQAKPVIPSDPVIETPTEQPVSLRQILDIAGIVYLTGAAIFLVWSLVSYFIYTRKILRSAGAADNRTQQIFSTICKKYGMKKQPTLLVASGIHSPAAFGIFRRKIVLPDITFNENGLVGTLAHEVTHCKRGDLYMKLVELIACSLNWFNPLVHIAAFQCEMEMELSCDEKVLSGSSDAARAAYGEVMLDIIRRCRRNRGALTTHFNPKKSAVTARFKNILYGSGKRRGRILIGVCLVLCILAGTFVACQIGDDLPEDHWYAEGYYLKCDNGSDVIVMDADGANPASPCQMTPADDSVSFEGLTDGDRIKIEISMIMTTYPGQTEVYSIEKLSDGERDDIDSAVLDSLHELGWIDDTTNQKELPKYLEIPVITLTQIETLPYSEETAVFTASPVGGNPTIFFFDDSRTFYFRKYLSTNMDAEFFTGTLTLPDGFTDAKLLHVTRGAGSGEIFVSIEAIYDGKKEYLTYGFFGTEVPSGVDVLDEVRVQRLMEAMEQMPAMFSITRPSDYTESDVIDVCSDEYGEVIAVTSNVDLSGIEIVEIVRENDFEIAELITLHTVDLVAGEPLLLKVSFPGVTGNRGLIYRDTDGMKKCCEITKSGEDGKILLISSESMAEKVDDTPKHSYTSDIDNFVPPEADSLPKITVLTTGKVLLTYETEEKLPLVYFGQGVDAETMQVTKTEFEAPDFTYTDYEVIDYLYESGYNVYATVRFTRTGGTQTDVYYYGYMTENPYGISDQDYKWVVFSVEEANARNLARGQYDPEKMAELIPNENAQVLFWLKTKGSCYYFCSIRTRNSASNAYTDDPPKDFAIYYQLYDQNYFSVIDKPIPAEYKYDSVIPVKAITGEGCYSMSCILKLTDGDRTYCLRYAEYEGIDQVYHTVSDDEVKALANIYPEVFASIEATVKITEHKFHIPLSDERDYIVPASIYGEIHPYVIPNRRLPLIQTNEYSPDGVGYVTFGVANDMKPSNVFSRCYTYRITQKGGYIVSVEEVETITKETVLQNGTPYSGKSAGRFTGVAYDRTRTATVSGNEISVGSYQSHTDAGGTYVGTYTYDAKTGDFFAELAFQYHDNGNFITNDPETISGKLYEYGGFVHFVCTSSNISTVNVNDTLPMTFFPVASNEEYQMTKYTEIDAQTGYELSFSIPESWNNNTDGVLYDEKGNKRINAFSFPTGYPFESFKDDLREIANGKLHNLDYAITGTNQANIGYIGYHISVNPIGESGPSNYYFCLNYDDDARFYINIYGENIDNYNTFYDEYVLPIIQSVTIGVTGDHVDTITSLEDYKLLGPDFYESYYEYTRALIDGDTAKMEELSMYPEGTLDSYKDVRFTFKSVTREAETGRFILTAEVSEGHAVIPGGTQQFYYCEYPRRALVPILEPPAPNATEASAELSKLLNMTMKFNLDEMEVTEYVIDCLYRKTGKTNFTENEIVEYAKKCFGVDSFTPNEHFKRDGVYTSLAHGGNHIYHDVISTNYGDESGIYSVTVRFYADYAKTVYSHLIKYTMVKLDGDFSFLAQYIEEESPLKPFTHAT